MKRLFMATNPGCIENIETAWYEVEPENEFADGDKLLGFNADMRRFEQAVPSQDYQVFIVNDKIDNPLDGLAIGPDDYLIYHSRTTKESVQSLFLPSRKIPSSHDPDASKSCFARVLGALPDMAPGQLPALIETLFESRKREIDLFLCHLLGEWPELPESLSFLKNEYEKVKSSPNDREMIRAFIQKCIEKA